MLNNHSINNDKPYNTTSVSSLSPLLRRSWRVRKEHNRQTDEVSINVNPSIISWQTRFTMWLCFIYIFLIICSQPIRIDMQSSLRVDHRTIVMVLHRDSSQLRWLLYTCIGWSSEQKKAILRKKSLSEKTAVRQGSNSQTTDDVMHVKDVKLGWRAECENRESKTNSRCSWVRRRKGLNQLLP